MTSGVTKPSSVARHGTIAGTQVRVRAYFDPSAIGENNCAAAASLTLGHEAMGSANFFRSGGCHMRTAYLALRRGRMRYGAIAGWVAIERAWASASVAISASTSAVANGRVGVPARTASPLELGVFHALARNTVTSTTAAR